MQPEGNTEIALRKDNSILYSLLHIVLYYMYFAGCTIKLLNTMTLYNSVKVREVLIKHVGKCSMVHMYSRVLLHNIHYNSLLFVTHTSNS